jgi:hypothetical protein
VPSLSTMPGVDPWLMAADLLDPPPNPYRTDLRSWATARLGAFLWSKQRDIAESLIVNRYTAVPSCFDSGKSWLASVVASWWLDVHPVGSAFVVTTAPTDPQVKAILWREIQARFEDAVKVGEPLPGRVTLDAQWKSDTGRLIGYGRKPANYNEAAFQGIHDRFVLVIMDEADGIPQSIYDAADGLLTNEDARCLAIGNPFDPSGPFAKACAPGSGWHTVRIAADDTPNFTGEVVPDYLPPLLISKLWVEERAKRWGVGTPRWVSKVEGRFPKVSDDTLIEPAWIQRAAERDVTPDDDDQALGVDVARYGDDETCIGHRRGGWFRLIHIRSKFSTMRTAGLVAKAVREIPARPIAAIDADGLGAGVFDRLQEIGVAVVALHGGAKPSNAEGEAMFGNARAEWYWSLRRAFAAGEVDLDPADDDLMAQLGAMKYKVDSRGRIWIETKDAMRKRGLSSPDRADTMAYSFANAGGVRPEEWGGTWGHTDTEGAEAVGFTGDLLSREM